ncbi:hypothetical protein BJ684DRAFT_16169 [Piptocephalis cylindrospora]|uniref:Uncharacterized protein n=1 Tax=Piptocephalis cylindrospora TaxID=1907219 RepID=A0A4P9Y3C0_9FUNG|nr:hypothetical protein BJ684DRAFT_16169 [Piptocephalis cylindrospora]|eukprot:RKP13428.1 hypothetical protein BJ684DRAFT_16169 [Piptocephalis cylindrospora]
MNAPACVYWLLVLSWISPWIPLAHTYPSLEKVLSKTTSSSAHPNAQVSAGGTGAVAKPLDTLSTERPTNIPYIPILGASAAVGLTMATYKTNKGLREYNETLAAAANGTEPSKSNGIPSFLGGSNDTTASNGKSS